MKSKDNIILAPTDYKGANWPEHGMIMMNHENRCSNSYKFSVKDKNDPLILALKKRCVEHNKYTRKTAYKYGWNMNDGWLSLRRITLKARGPRAIHAKAMGYHPRAYDQSLPHRFAKYFDVYYHEDTHANWMFNYRKEDRMEKAKLEAELEEVLACESNNNAEKAKIIAKMKELR